MIKKKIKNVYNMLKYAYAKDINIKCTNVKYGNDKKQYYKVYKQNNNKPTIFFVHGGGWCQGSPSLYSGVGKYYIHFLFFFSPCILSQKSVKLLNSPFLFLSSTIASIAAVPTFFTLPSPKRILSSFTVNFV